MNIITLFITSLLAFTSFPNPTETVPESGEIKVYIFLHESCRISQFYTLSLKQLHEQYGNEKIIFEGIFPNQKTEKSDLDAFKKKYDLSFKMIIDKNQTLTKKFGATITPEVIVYNSKEEKIIYKGRIDDSYFRVGKRRQVTTTFELEDVLEAVSKGEPVTVENMTAIGCYIRKV